MEQNLSCEIVRDLLPNYLEKLTSDSTNQSIEEHLEQCNKCKQVYDEMKGNISIEAAPEAKDLKKYLNKTKVMYSMLALLSLGIFAIITCLIVDIAVSRKLSWSLIVTASIVYSYALVYVFIKGGKMRFFLSLVFITAFTIPLLGVIQLVTYYNFMSNPTVWFWSIGVPISSIWIGILWVAVLANRMLKWNVFHCFSLLLLLSVVGNYYTNLIAGGETGFIDDVLGNVSAAAVLFVIGLIANKRKREDNH